MKNFLETSSLPDTAPSVQRIGGNASSLITLLLTAFIISFGAMPNADAQSTNFESFILGTVNYQGTGSTVNTGPPGNYTIPNPYGSLWTVSDEWGFQKTGSPFDEEVKDDGFGNKVWRMSNSVTSGSFSFQPCSQSTALVAGESTAALYNDRGNNHTTPLNPPNPHANSGSSYFHGGFKFKSATGTAQPGLFLSINATPRQSSVRMTYIGLSDNGSTGIDLTFIDVAADGATFPTTTIASNLSYTDWHRVDFYVQFVDGMNGDGSGNDIVTVMLDGNVIHTGTTWETFYASPSWTSTPDPIAVDALMFRSGGTAVPTTAGNGYYFDNVVYDNESLPVKVRVYSDLAETDYVNGYSTIQAAIDNSTTQNGYVVRVAAGTYAENVVVNKSLTINGPNFGTSGCVLRAGEAMVQGTFTIGADNITIDGFELTGAGAQILSSGANSTWSHITIQNNYIHATTAQQPILHGFGSGGGIGTQNWTVIRNKIEDIQATDATSIVLFNIDDLTMADNCITHANASFNGRRGVNLDGCQDVVFDGNTVNMGLVSPASDNSDGAFTKARYQLQLSASFQSVLNVTVTENNLGGAYDGILTLGNGLYDGITITKNTTTHNVIGVRFQAGTNAPTGAHSNFIVTNNDISTSNRCIYLQDGTAGSGTADTYSGIAINNNSLIRSSTGAALEVQSTALLSGGSVNATCNWYGTSSAATVATLVSGSVTYVPFLSNGTDSAPATPGFQPAPSACIGGIPQLVAYVNNVTVTANNNGTTDTGTASVCSGVTNNISITTTFQDLANLSTTGQPVRVYQTVALNNVSGVTWCNNCQAVLSAFTAGISTTATLTNPSLPGSVVATFQAWHDLDNNSAIDPGELIGDIVQYTITVNPTPAISFTAQVAGDTPQNGSSNGPTSVTLNFCAGESFSYSNYVSVPGGNVGVLNDLSGTGNVTYNGAPVSVPRAQIDFGVGGTPGFFNGTYGPYGLGSGTTGQFVEIFTPYYDADNSGTYTSGDCLGTPVTITYNVYALPNAIVNPVSQTICTNSSTSIALSSSVPGTTFSWVVQGTTGMVSGQAAGSGNTISQTLINSGNTNAFVTYRITPTGPAPNYCEGPTTDVTVTVLPALGITCQASFNVGTSSNGIGNCNGVANWSHPVQPGGSCSFETLTMSINGGTPVPVTPGAAISQTLNVGMHTVAYVATDIASNTANCSFTITVTDDEAPVVSCANQTITFNGEASLPLNVSALVSAADNCGIQSISISPMMINCEQVGQNVPVTATIIDVNGVTSTCTLQITVVGLPCGWSSDSNSIGCNNNLTYASGTGTWTNTASSCFYGPPFTADDVAFAQRTLCGNGSITARVNSIDALAAGWAGVVMRESNAPGAKKAQLMTNLGNLSRREFRIATNGQSTPQQFPSQNRYWLRITRTGNQFNMFISQNGISWSLAGTQQIAMSQCIEIGLVTTNNQPNTTVTTVFSNVSFSGANTPLALPGNSTPAGLADFSSELEVDFSVFPNPTSGELNLDLTQYIGRSVRIETYSLEGKLLGFTELDEVQNTLERLDLKGFQNGMYLVKVKSVGLPEVARRVVKQ